MIYSLLAYLAPEPPRGAFTISILFLFLFYALPLLGIIWLIRYLIRSARERRLLRLEVGKLADEVHQLQQSNQHAHEKQDDS